VTTVFISGVVTYTHHNIVYLARDNRTGDDSSGSHPLTNHPLTTNQGRSDENVPSQRLLDGGGRVAQPQRPRLAMDHRRQLSGRVPVTDADGGFGRIGGDTVCRTGTGRVASSARADNSRDTGDAVSGAAIDSDITCGTGGTCSGSGLTTVTLVRHRREIIWVLRSGRIFA